ncbi:MAG: PAS domain S-box protein [Candidatus Lokiarchaeota archaeon]|nr:PAS domain S-box protein [Candidatus Lokiarchaeota archaeon]
MIKSSLLKKSIFKILLIEDNTNYVGLIKEMLNEGNENNFILYEASQLKDGLLIIDDNKDIDIILLDPNLSDSYGLRTLEKILEKTQNIPIIILMEGDDVEQGIEGLQKGAQDYLIIDEISSQLLIRSIYYSIERFKLILNQLDAENKIIRLNKILQAIKQINQIIKRKKDKKNLIIEACKSINESLGYLGSYIILINDENKIELYADAGIFIRCDKFEDAINKRIIPKCALKVLKDENIHLINEIDDFCDPSCVFLNKKKKFTILSLKLNYLNNEFGIFTVFFPEKWVNNDEELALFKEIANNISYALYLIELEEKQKKTEEYLMESEGKYQNLFTNAPIPYISISPNGSIININKAVIKLLGYSEQELRKMKVIDLYADDSKLKGIELFKTYRQGLSFENEELIYLTKDGREIPSLLSVSSLKDKKGNVIESLSIVVDISTLKKTQKQLEESEEKFRSIFEAIPDLFFLVNKDFEILDFQAKDIDDLFVSADQFLHRKVIEMLPYDISIQIQEAILKTFKFKTIQILEYSLPSNSHPQYFEGRFLPFKEDKVAVFIRDITDRKLAEQRILESEEQFRTISEQALVGIAILQDDIVKYMNQKYADIINYSIDEVLNWGEGEIYKTFHPDDRKMVRTYASERQKGKKDILNKYFCRAIKKSNEIIWLEVYATTMNYRGKPADLITILDITDRKKAEIHLHESEEKFRSIAEQTSLGIALIQDDFIKYANKALEIITEYSINDILSWSPREFINVVYEDDRIQSSEILLDFYRGKITESTPEPFRIRTKSNKIIWLELHAKSIHYEGKSAILVSFFNITQKRVALQKLKESEERFRSIAEQTMLGIAIIQDGSFKYINETLSNIFGYSSEEMLFWTLKEFFDVIHPDDRENALKVSSNFSIKDQKDLLFNAFRVITKDDEIKWIESYLRTIEIESREATLITVFDVTEKRLVEKRIRDNEEKDRIESIIETIPDSILVLDSTGSLVLANKTFKDIYYEIVKVEMPSKFNVFDHIKIDFFNEISRILSLRDSEFRTIEPIKGLHLQVSFAELKLPGEESYGAIFEFRNVSSFVEFENLRRKFVSTISHELRTPISVIVQSIDNIIRYGEQISKDLKNEIMQTMNLNADLLLNMVEDLLTISRIEEKKFKLDWKEYNIFDICAEVAAQLEPKRDEKKVFITYDIAEDIILNGDSKKIAQVFRIIVDNAIKYIPSECILHVRAQDHYFGEYNSKNRDGVLIQFIDNGNGIPEDELQYIFERFFRSREVADIPGTGLGLPIAKEIVQLHVGEIFAESEFGKGSKFTIFLPRLNNLPNKIEERENLLKEIKK